MVSTSSQQQISNQYIKIALSRAISIYKCIREMVTDVVTNPYRGIAELLSIGFCARNTDSNPRCLINSEKRHSYE